MTNRFFFLLVLAISFFSPVLCRLEASTNSSTIRSVRSLARQVRGEDGRKLGVVDDILNEIQEFVRPAIDKVTTDVTNKIDTVKKQIEEDVKKIVKPITDAVDTLTNEAINKVSDFIQFEVDDVHKSDFKRCTKSFVGLTELFQTSLIEIPPSPAAGIVDEILDTDPLVDIVVQVLGNDAIETICSISDAIFGDGTDEEPDDPYPNIGAPANYTEGIQYELYTVPINSFINDTTKRDRTDGNKVSELKQYKSYIEGLDLLLGLCELDVVSAGLGAATGGVGTVACLLGVLVKDVISFAIQTIIDRCDHHDGLVDNTEIEAAYENSRLILKDLHDLASDISRLDNNVGVALANLGEALANALANLENRLNDRLDNVDNRLHSIEASLETSTDGRRRLAPVGLRDSHGPSIGYLVGGAQVLEVSAYCARVKNRKSGKSTKSSDKSLIVNFFVNALSYNEPADAIDITSVSAYYQDKQYNLVSESGAFEVKRMEDGLFYVTATFMTNNKGLKYDDDILHLYIIATKSSISKPILFDLTSCDN